MDADPSAAPDAIKAKSHIQGNPQGSSVTLQKTKVLWKFTPAKYGSKNGEKLIERTPRGGIYSLQRFRNSSKAILYDLEKFGEFWMHQM